MTDKVKKDILWSIYDHEFDNLEEMDWFLKTQPIPNIKSKSAITSKILIYI